jgi:hypothetical protein
MNNPVLPSLDNCSKRLDFKTKGLPLRENLFQHFELILKSHAVEIFDTIEV